MIPKTNSTNQTGSTYRIRKAQGRKKKQKKNNDNCPFGDKKYPVTVEEMVNEAIMIYHAKNCLASVTFINH